MEVKERCVVVVSMWNRWEVYQEISDLLFPSYPAQELHVMHSCSSRQHADNSVLTYTLSVVDLVFDLIPKVVYEIRPQYKPSISSVCSTSWMSYNFNFCFGLGEFHLRLRHLEQSLLQALNEVKGRILDDDR